MVFHHERRSLRMRIQENRTAGCAKSEMLDRLPRVTEELHGVLQECATTYVVRSGVRRGPTSQGAHQSQRPGSRGGQVADGRESGQSHGVRTFRISSGAWRVLAGGWGRTAVKRQTIAIANRISIWRGRISPSGCWIGRCFRSCGS